MFMSLFIVVLSMGLSLLIATMAYLPVRGRVDLPHSAGLALCHLPGSRGHHLLADVQSHPAA